jgi:DNA mismatch endonuclease (patch repair protein)
MSTEKRFRSSLVRARLKSWLVHPKMQFSPDFVFENKPIAIFLDGCFWHGCPVCKNKIPVSNKEYWTPKLQRNIERDKLATTELSKQGWIVLRFWEHEITNNLSNCIDKVKDALSYAPDSCFLESYKSIMGKKMNDKPFYEWLITKANYSRKSAADMVSRCKRVQKMYGMELNKILNTSDGFIALHDKIKADSDKLIKPGSTYNATISPLLVATRKYHKFLLSLSN